MNSSLSLSLLQLLFSKHLVSSVKNYAYILRSRFFFPHTLRRTFVWFGIISLRHWTCRSIINSHLSLIPPLIINNIIGQNLSSLSSLHRPEFTKMGWQEMCDRTSVTTVCCKHTDTAPFKLPFHFSAQTHSSGNISLQLQRASVDKCAVLFQEKSRHVTFPHSTHYL
jgi:hypothetical protein